MQVKNFQAFLKSYVEFLEEVAAGESEKHAAILSYDAKRLDKANSNQQALNMRLAKMEEQREAEQEKAGFGGKTFRQILEKLEGQERAEFEQLFQRFTQAVNDIKYFNAKSMSFAQGGLEILGVSEKKAVARPYGANGKRPEGAASTSLFEKQV